MNTTNLSTCRFCGNTLTHTFVDLGMSPLCESFVPANEANQAELFYPLHTYICDKCFLVQLDEYVSPDKIFDDYAYFSSYSDSWVQHAKTYADAMQTRFGIDKNKLVMEVASNDGYLLQHFVAQGVPVLGIEPASNVAEAAVEKGVRTIVKFLGEETATDIRAEYGQADLLLGNNVLAHVPNINDFVKGLKILLKPDGLLTMEFPHLYQLMKENQFDTIYHEHFSYLSLLAVEQVFAAQDMIVFDVEELQSHGGSLRIYVQHSSFKDRSVCQRVEKLRKLEKNFGMDNIDTYQSFEEQVKETKRKLLEFLIKIKREGKTVAGYGAPGKGNTLLNYCGIRQDFIDYTVDRNPYKHGRFTPGTRIPIFPPEQIEKTKPDYVLILPWNLEKEIAEQLSYIRDWGGKFVVPIPEVRVF